MVYAGTGGSFKTKKDDKPQNKKYLGDNQDKEIIEYIDGGFARVRKKSKGHAPARTESYKRNIQGEGAQGPHNHLAGEDEASVGFHLLFSFGQPGEKGFLLADWCLDDGRGEILLLQFKKDGPVTFG
jgi:hypothetical protein